MSNALVLLALFCLHAGVTVCAIVVLLTGLVAYGPAPFIRFDPADAVDLLHSLTVEPFTRGGDPDGLTILLVLVLPVLVIQWLMILPLRGMRPPERGRSRSLRGSLVIGGMLAAALTTGLVSGLVSLADSILDRTGVEPLWEAQAPVILLGTFGAGWTFWTIILFGAMRDIWPDRVMARLMKAVFVGSIAEFVLMLPIDVLARRRSSCHCSEGSFAGLMISGTAALCVLGPGVALFLTRGRYRRWRRTHCERCGHPRGPTPGPQCPECGHPAHGAGA